MTTYFVVVVWLTCGFVGSGFENAQAQHDERWRTLAAQERWSDWIMSMLIAALGPVNIVISLLDNGWSCGWSLVPGCGVDRKD